MKSKKGIIISITSLFLITILLLGLTYAYYRTRIIGNNSEEPSISVTSKTLEIVYSDGTSEVNMTGLIEPGFSATKTFSVENTGSEEVLYAVYLEDVVNEYARTEDWEFEVTCSPNCSGTDGVVEFPQLSEMLVKNKIASGVTQTYTMTLNYKKLDNVDQSEDMGKHIAFKFQIYSPEDVVDIEGTIANAEDGDYVEINSVPKKSQIVDGKYRLPAVEVGSHTLKVMKSDGTEKGTTSLTIEKGIEENISDSNITIDNNSQVATINITNISETLEIEVTEIKDHVVKEGTIIYAILNDNEVIEPLSTVGSEISLESESVLAETLDDYGTSYYFRGNVQNNYVNFAGMCWKIVRIQGDGGVKVILEDQYAECNDNETVNTAAVYTGDWGIPTTTGGTTFKGNYGYENKNMDSDSLVESVMSYLQPVTNANYSMARAFYDFQTDKLGSHLDKLKSGNWCIADKVYIRSGSFGSYTYTLLEQADYSKRMYYDVNLRLFVNDVLEPTFKCTGTTMDRFQSVLYKEEEIIKEAPMYVSTITADEIIYAGGSSFSDNNNFYLLNENQKNSTTTLTTFCSLSPFNYDLSSDGIYCLKSGGETYNARVLNDASIRPAVVLSSNVMVLVGGNGTQSNPYVIG